MMEKYGVDMEELPVTDDQLRQLRDLAQDNVYRMPKNRKEADEMIEQMTKQGK